jgi:predicted N-formylglutamate amidohydrolase
MDVVVTLNFKGHLLEDVAAEKREELLGSFEDVVERDNEPHHYQSGNTAPLRKHCRCTGLSKVVCFV